MRLGQFAVGLAAAIGVGLGWPRIMAAADSGEIKARLAGMEITDGVQWAEQYMRDGTYRNLPHGQTD